MPKASETKVRLSFRLSKIMVMIKRPITGLVCNRTGTKVAYSTSKKSTMALMYAVIQSGHLGISINKIVDRKDMEPLAASTFLGATNFVLQHVVFMVFTAIIYHFVR